MLSLRTFLPFLFSDKLIGAISGQMSSTDLPYTCVMTAGSPNEVRLNN